MITAQTDYAMLMASLPPHALSLWDIKNKRLSSVQLERHLSVLNAKDRQTLRDIEIVLHWAKMPTIEEEQQLIKNTDQLLMELKNSFLHEVIVWRLNIRTIMASIRRRKLNRPIVDHQDYLGHGEIAAVIKKNWQVDDFSLAFRFPWIKEANQLFNNNETLALEKLLLHLSWQHYERLGQGHYFDFEAVVIYVLRWDIINRWAQNDEQKAMQQFELLVEQALII